MKQCEPTLPTTYDQVHAMAKAAQKLHTWSAYIWIPSIENARDCGSAKHEK